MKISMSLSIIVCFLLCLVPSRGISANDLSKYLPDQIDKFCAASSLLRENKKEKEGVCICVRRFYKCYSERALCKIAIMKGVGVSDIISKTFASGEKLTIKEFEAILNPPQREKGRISASVKLGPNFLITAVITYEKRRKADKYMPVSILKALKLDEIAKLREI